jgi:hypothetical protein
MAMIDANQAAQKIATAAVGIERARKALPSPEYNAKVRAAERRLATLLRAYKGFKDDPAFAAAYRREMSALCEAGPPPATLSGSNFAKRPASR